MIGFFDFFAEQKILVLVDRWERKPLELMFSNFHDDIIYFQPFILEVSIMFFECCSFVAAYKLKL